MSDLDLDALAPKPVSVTFEGKEIQVPPLTIEQFARLTAIGTSMSTLTDPKNIDKAAPIYTKIDELVKEVVPDLKDKTLNPMQLTSLFTLLASENTPTDEAVKELEKRGIKLNEGDQSDPKASDSDEPSPSS